MRIALLTLIPLVLRLAYIALVPDYDGDAYAHFEFAVRTLEHPLDLKVHWVWLPGQHYLIALLQLCGASFRGVRIVNAILQCAGPLLVWKWTRSELAMVLYAVSSLGNLAGTTAMPEVPFTLCILAACFFQKQGAKAGIFLLVACTMRYEAWFAVMLLGLTELYKRKITLASVIPSAGVLAYIALRYKIDGELLWFIRETYRFTHMQRGLTTASPIFNALWFPVFLPAMLLGPAIVFLPKAIWRAGFHPIPTGLAAFLILTYAGGGTLGQARYLTVLMPFACILIATRADWRRLAIASVAGASIFWIARTALRADLNDLRAREDRANRVLRDRS